MPATPFADRLREICVDRGISVERAWAIASGPDGTGPSLSSLRKVMAGERALTMRLMEAMANALGVDPTEFAEYRLANARALLDEREVGLDQALDVLTRIEDALASAPRARRATEAGRQARSQTPTPAVQPAPTKRRAGGGRKSA